MRTHLKYIHKHYFEKSFMLHNHNIKNSKVSSLQYHHTSRDDECRIKLQKKNIMRSINVNYRHIIVEEKNEIENVRVCATSEGNNIRCVSRQKIMDFLLKTSS